MMLLLFPLLLCQLRGVLSISAYNSCPGHTLNDATTLNVTLGAAYMQRINQPHFHAMGCSEKCREQSCTAFTTFDAASQTCALHFNDPSTSSLVKQGGAKLYELGSTAEGSKRTICMHTGVIDCQQLYESGSTANGVYSIFPIGGAPVDVYCDMEMGGWTVISSKTNADWNKPWADYKVGFGDPAGQYYVGNDNIFFLTNQGTYKLEIELLGWDNSVNTFRTATFSIDDESNQYQLSISGFSSTPSTLSDIVTWHNGMKFTTVDIDNDQGSSNCAVLFGGGFWFKSCHRVHPTSNYCLSSGTESCANCMSFYTASSGCVKVQKAVMRIKRI